MVSDSFVGANTPKLVGKMGHYREGDRIPTTTFSYLDRAGTNDHQQSIAKVMCDCGRAEDIPWYWIQHGRKTTCEQCHRKAVKLTYRKFAGVNGLGLTPKEFYRWNDNVWGLETKERPTAGQLYGMVFSLELEAMKVPRELIRKAWLGLQAFNHDDLSDDYLMRFLVVPEQVKFYLMAEDYMVLDDLDNPTRVCYGRYWDLRKRTYWKLRGFGIDNDQIGHPNGNGE